MRLGLFEKKRPVLCWAIALERVALTSSQYCTVSLQFFAEKRLHILRNCSRVAGSIVAAGLAWISGCGE